MCTRPAPKAWPQSVSNALPMPSYKYLYIICISRCEHVYILQLRLMHNEVFLSSDFHTSVFFVLHSSLCLYLSRKRGVRQSLLFTQLETTVQWNDKIWEGRKDYIFFLFLVMIKKVPQFMEGGVQKGDKKKMAEPKALGTSKLKGQYQ